MKRKKAERKEKPVEVRYTVVRVDDVRIPKYLHSEASLGFTVDHANALAAPVDGQLHRYVTVPLDVHQRAREHGEPIDSAQALQMFAEPPA